MSRYDPPVPSVRGLTATVPREFVHRASVAEVFLTGWHERGSDRFTVFAQWPRGHSFYSPIAKHYDPMLAAETIRQVGALLAHAAFDVPMGHQFLMWELSYDVVPALLRIGSAPMDLEIDVRCVEIKRRGGRLTGLRYEAVLRSEGEIVAEGGARYTVTTPEAYRRLRASRNADVVVPDTSNRRLSPLFVGRADQNDVVLARTGTPGQWLLHIDLSHPVLFDHFVDHVPGMMLLEAARQAALTVGSPEARLLPQGVAGTFHRYAELDSPCWIHVNSVTPTVQGQRARITGHQGGNAVFTATVDLFTVPAGAG
ncbi:ScbA/BarX family gamma-butyrolactone biosynthesis protein [Streptomyces fragilis]|uniref:ScbA/BarX family gamma-butyrolactone biosynthesis protein n=1 Tax=Streptomyces fragilis TaxID=67301 RepID=A0ABV2YEX3_9ACTN|nr:ScbA/BarX family gamma-butyrolactone biosynthesis protein [Streptomyces fragilis]